VVGPVPGITGTVVVGAGAVLCVRGDVPGTFSFTGTTGL
jgi:hypothetical protein